MTLEQKAAISQCIQAFNIPRDCEDFVLRIYADRDRVSCGIAPQIRADLTVDHHPANPSEV